MTQVTPIISRGFVLGMMQDLAGYSKRLGDLLQDEGKDTLGSWVSRLDILLSLISGPAKDAQETSQQLLEFIQDCVSFVNAGKDTQRAMESMRDEEGYAFALNEEWEVSSQFDIPESETVMAVIANRYHPRTGGEPIYGLRFASGDELPVGERQLYLMTNSYYRAERAKLLANINQKLRAFREEEK